VDGVLVTETPSILLLLDRLYPDAALLPRHEDPVLAAEGLSDLNWCSSGLHPLTRAIYNPGKMTEGDPVGVRAKGMEQFAVQAAIIEARLADGPWWYGERWSIVDIYVFWAYDSARRGGYDLAPCPNMRAHALAVRGRPSFVRALGREQAALGRAGVVMPPEE
jgi:glutathione S-transferase